ncbi:MAG TPA: alpha/beta fold hydrolase [Caldimonas sp.]|nr:alpha/beta fold hydrolase [Caldimonas sp.]
MDMSFPLVSAPALAAPPAAARRPTGNDIDRRVRAAVGRTTGTMSVASGLLAAADWAMNLTVSPGKQMELGLQFLDYVSQVARYDIACWIAGDGDTRRFIEPPAHDRRFADDAWLQWPFNVLHQAFLLYEQLWSQATHGVSGVERHHEELVSFAARQLLDVASPGNALLTNPVALQRTYAEGGQNLMRGFGNALLDMQRLAAGMPPPGAENFVVGRDVAVTPGKVVLKNRLMELIQYAPSTAEVIPEPVLLVPSWIMKYYILDLSPGNSLVKYLVDRGHTVFCVSWKNPGADERDLGMDDYLRLGLWSALDAVHAIVPDRKVHALGYCNGGTLLAIGAAAMARDGIDRLASMTLLAAQTDFKEPGELGLFIDEAQITLLEAQMAETGYLTTGQMAGAFHMLRSNDLLWSRVVSHYLLGESGDMNDLMAWNADATRLPARMHSEYLRQLFLHDDLAENRYIVGGRPVTLGDVKLPVFLVGTVTDHVAPWRSVYKLHYLSPAEITFALTSGGHNAGIVNPPGKGHRRYQLLTSGAGESRLDPDRWLAAAPELEGSWWPAWHEWLRSRSAAPADPPRMGIAGERRLEDAPGRYVKEK